MSMARYRKMHMEGVWPPGTLPAPPWSYPIQDASQLGQLTEALLRRGWSESDLRKVLGENFLRLFRTAWKGESGAA
jgi:membrane dipeptidase